MDLGNLSLGRVGRVGETGMRKVQERPPPVRRNQVTGLRKRNPATGVQRRSTRATTGTGIGTEKGKGKDPAPVTTSPRRRASAKPLSILFSF